MAFIDESGGSTIFPSQFYIALHKGNCYAIFFGRVPCQVQKSDNKVAPRPFHMHTHGLSDFNYTKDDSIHTQLQIINLNFLSSKPYEIKAIWLKKFLTK